MAVHKAVKDKWGAALGRMGVAPAAPTAAVDGGVVGAEEQQGRGHHNHHNHHHERHDSKEGGVNLDGMSELQWEQVKRAKGLTIGWLSLKTFSLLHPAVRALLLEQRHALELKERTAILQEVWARACARAHVCVCMCVCACCRWSSIVPASCIGI